MNIAYPLQISSEGRLLQADLEKHIRDMLEQILFTSPGERVNRPDFGSGVQQLVFAPNGPALAATVEANVIASVQRWLGDLIDPRELSVVNDDAKLVITISYILKLTGDSREVRFERGVS